MSDTEMNWLVQAIGLLGAIAILYCFIKNMMGQMAADSKTYLLLNLTGGVLVSINSLWFGAYPALLINVVWFIASAVGYIKAVRQRG